MLNTEKRKESTVHYIWILITAQARLARVMRKIYKTVSSFCVIAFSVKKIDGFIMLPHCVHVWVQCARVGDMFGKTILVIDGAL